MPVAQGRFEEGIRGHLGYIGKRGLVLDAIEETEGDTRLTPAV
jgi:hypothetical protein